MLQVNVKAKSAFNNKLFALNVVISIPVPDNTAKADIQTTQGMQLPQKSKKNYFTIRRNSREAHAQPKLPFHTATPPWP